MFQKTNDISLLAKKAQGLRLDIVKMLAAAGSGHPGGSLSVIDILVTLYFAVMNHDPADPQNPDRDRLLLSKGHAAPALYAVLAECGYFPKWHLDTLRKLGSILQGHPDMHITPGIDISSGSLGQGLSIACGMAASARLDSKKHMIYCVLGDGELQEGQVWEAAMSAAHYKLDKLCAVLDSNKLQIDGTVKDIMNIEDVAAKFTAFGWETVNADGHDYDSLLSAFQHCKAVTDKPSIIIAHTVKGKGVSFMEHNLDFHGRAPTNDETSTALNELGGA